MLVVIRSKRFDVVMLSSRMASALYCEKDLCSLPEKKEREVLRCKEATKTCMSDVCFVFCIASCSKKKKKMQEPSKCIRSTRKEKHINSRS